MPKYIYGIDNVLIRFSMFSYTDRERSPPKTCLVVIQSNKINLKYFKKIEKPDKEKKMSGETPEVRSDKKKPKMLF